ncbi:MAG TPA: glycoside hydrolase family 2 TIM barrel-domain containing protein [Verrucomicrobiae bacterium]|nr:glycoside hydrolase family 2 TIM barrel-domain containing protein [Verrucomicrobiae bacterium]
MNRRNFLRHCAVGASFMASGAIVGCAGTSSSRGATRAASLALPLDQDWLFGGKFVEGADQPGFNDSAFSHVTLPHCVAKLSWQNWDPSTWEDVWIYRRHFSMPDGFRNHRIFLDFDKVMLGAKPVINGKALPEHLGGYLPFHYEITEWLKEKDNVLAVTVDSRWQKVPPEGNPKGPTSVDYLEAGGIPGSVTLRVMPPVFISDVFAKPVKVLDPDRHLEIIGVVDAAAPPSKPVRIKVDLMSGHRRVATASKTLQLEKAGETNFQLALPNLGNVQLWNLETPHLYDVVATLIVDEQPMHGYRTRVGLREARCEVDGFFLNGRRVRLFGLNRHEVYPYVGYAMPDRVMRRDAEILRHEFNCNIVRCSHYPQKEAFLDACDELGLMVWQEPPGWGYLGDDAWKEFVVRDVREMILRDRNHPSIVICGVRVNESRNDPPLYQRTTEIAKTLDGTRATSGSMTNRRNWEKEWHEDVFAMDDYHSAPDGSVAIEKPIPGLPYMLSEVVGQWSYGGGKGFTNRYRRAGDLAIQTHQAILHAQAHDRAAAYEGFLGVIGWCAFDYASLMNHYQAVKCPGVSDVFRIPKLGASFYQSQISPQIRPVIKPSFFWDFGPKSPRGPGQNSAIFSNCDRLEVFIAGKKTAELQPDRANYPHLKYPPFFCHLDLDGSAKPELRIDGYVGNRLALSRSFSSDPGHDQFLLAADDAELIGNGADATRLVFKVADKYGAERAFANGDVTFEITGPGVIVGDNPFALADSGGVGAIWIKAIPNSSGQITVKATHSSLGTKSVNINVSQPR